MRRRHGRSQVPGLPSDHRLHVSQVEVCRRFYLCPSSVAMQCCSFVHIIALESTVSMYEHIHPAITLFRNNGITLCSYYVHLPVTLREQLPTFVDNVMRLFIVQSYVRQGKTSLVRERYFVC